MSQDKSSKLTRRTCHFHDHNLIQGIQTLKTNSLFFDVTLVAEGEAVPAHKLVLASCSDYFRVMFTGDMQESREDRIELKGITAQSMTSLINFAYTGKLELNMKNIEEVVSAASYFQMTDAIDVCARFLEGKLRSGNFVDILNLAETYAVDRIYENTEQYILSKFKTIPLNYLLKLSAKQLSGLLSSNSLLMNSEFQVFEKVLSWIENTSDLTEDIAFNILSKIRFPLMSREDLSVVGENKVMKSFPRCQELLSEALEYHKDVLKQPMMQTERTQIRAEQKSYIISSECRLCIMNAYSGRYEDLKETDPVEANYYLLKGIVVVDNFLYASHVYHRSRRGPDFVLFHRYDPRFNVWQKLPEPSMKWDLSLVLVPYKRTIYAVDRGDETSLILEAFSIENNKWETKASVQNRNCWFAGQAFQDKIYISGGEDSEKPDHQVYCYTPSSDTWETKAPMIEARKNHRMAEINKKLYAFGGDDADSVEYYLPGDDQWTLCERNLEFPVCGLIEDNEHIYLLRMENRGNDYSEITEMDGICLELYEPDSGRSSVTTASDFTFCSYYKVMCASLGFPTKP